VEWLERTWPGLMAVLLAPATLLALTLFSVVCFIASVLCATWAVRRLPVDFLLCEPARRRRTGWGAAVWVLRNLLGLVLLVLGVLMLVLPGQGVLTVIAALGLMDFRSKERFERWLMLRPRVFLVINRLRLRVGHPPMLAPGPSHLDRT
jgi:hypothetical protein